MRRKNMKNKIVAKIKKNSKTIKDEKGYYVEDDNIRFNFDLLPDTNFIKKFVNHFSPLTEAPNEYLLTSILTYTAAMLGNRRYTFNALGTTYPNVWAVIIGKTTACRKSTALKLAESLLKDVDYNYFYPQIIHGKTLIEKLEIDPYGIFIYNEWKSFASNIEKHNNSNLKAMLTELYDSHSYQKIIKNNDAAENEDNLHKIQIDKISISLIIASTLDWLKYNKTDLTSGFMPRFIFSIINKNYKDPIAFPGDKPKTELVNELDKYKKEIDKETKRLHISKEAKKLYKEWYIYNYHKSNDCKNDVLPGFWRRLEKYVYKFALILHCVGKNYKKDKIQVETMETAIHLQEYYRENINYLVRDKFTITKYKKAEKKVITYLKKNNRSATRRDLQSNISMLKKGRFLDQILDNLKGNGIIKRESIPTKAGGSKKNVIRLIKVDK